MRPRRSSLVPFALLLALVSAVGMGPAVADNPASGPTTTGQNLNVRITGPVGTLPAGTTSTTVSGLVSLGEPPTTEAHVSFVIDDSGSMSASDFQKEKAGAYSMLTKLQAIPHIEVHASLIFFATQVTVAVTDRPASSDADGDGITDFKEALDARAHIAQNTYTKNAVQAGINELSGKSGIKQMYLITDGVPSPSSQNPTPLAPALEAANIQVYTYAIGSAATCTTLKAISTTCTVVSNFDALPSTIVDQTVAGIESVRVKVGDGPSVVATIGGLGDFSAPVTGLQPGVNTIEATATSTDGTTLTATSTVTVGKRPTVEITDGPGPGFQNQSDASWSFSSPTSDLAADPYACKIDDGPYAPCTTPYSATLTDGAHTFSVTATDVEGNVSVPATGSVRIDTIAPSVRIDGGSQGTVPSSAAHLTFTVVDANPVETECILDGGVAEPCTSPTDLADLPDGEHTFEVVATDAAGNTGRDSRTWVVDTRADNAIAFEPVADQVLPTGSVDLDVTSSSGTVLLSSLTPEVCEISGTTASLLATGTCTIAADSPQSDDYHAAPRVIRSFGISKAAQTITFAQPDDTVYGGADVPLSASSSSTLPVELTSLTPSVCTVLGSTVQPVSAGTCRISAAQAGDAEYDAADSVVRALTVAKAEQAITFAQPGNTVFEGADVSLSASSTSGLPVSLTSQTPATCTVVAGKAHPAGAGVCTLTASQPGDDNHLPATPVTHSLTVAKAPITVTTSSSSLLSSLLTWRVTYRTVVKSATTGLPVAGVPVTARVNGGGASSGCSAVTNASGVATCTTGPNALALLTTHRATASATANYLGGEATARSPLL